MLVETGSKIANQRAVFRDYKFGVDVIPLSRYSAPAVVPFSHVQEKRGIEGVRRIEGVIWSILSSYNYKEGLGIGVKGDERRDLAGRAILLKEIVGA